MPAAISCVRPQKIRLNCAVLAPKGTQVRGVLRQFSKSGGGLSSSFSLTVEFTDLALAGGTVPFRAYLKRIDSPMEGLFWLVPSGAGTMRMEHSTGIPTTDAEGPGSDLRFTPQPGVAVLIFMGHNSFDLVPGTRMTWITSDDARKR